MHSNEKVESASGGEGGHEHGGSHSSHGFSSVWTSFVAGLAHVLLLTLLVVDLHKLHLLHETEAYFRRQAVQIFALNQIQNGTREVNSNGPVQVLEASAAMRINELEVRDLTLEPATIDRVGGVRPIDRCRLADLLSYVANALPEPDPDAGQVIGIDIDLAPVTNGEFDHDCTGYMIDALRSLRAKATVVAVAMDRATNEERAARNQFMREACATPKGSGLLPLHFSSPRVFHDYHSYPLDFPTGWKQHDEHESTARLQPQVEFPSLGNVLRASAFPHAAEPAAHRTKTNAKGHDVRTVLCEQAIDAAAIGPMLLEDLIAQDPPGNCYSNDSSQRCTEFDLELYEHQAYNWRWLTPDDVHVIPLINRGDLPCLGNECIDASNSRIRIISVDGGAKDDKFDVAAIAPDPVSGATLHALQVVSAQDETKELELHSGWAVLIDLAVGVVFLAAWKIASFMIEWRVPALVSTKFMLRLVVPALMAAAGFWWATHWLSPALLRLNVWANPGYILVGLTFHAYTEAWHQSAHHASPDFTFGLFRWRESWRQYEFDPFRAFGEWGDALASALAQWIVVGLGAVVLWESHLPAGAAAVVAAAIGFYRLQHVERHNP